jgi:hypothetical protein
MRIDFWNKARDEKIDLIFKWVIVLTVGVVIFMVWIIVNFHYTGQFFSEVGQNTARLQLAYEFDNSCEILSGVYRCNKDALEVIRPANYWWSSIYWDMPYSASNLLILCQMRFNDPTMTAEECVKACWRCSDIAPGSTCTTDEDCQKLLGNDSTCRLFDSQQGACVYRNLTK